MIRFSTSLITWLYAHSLVGPFHCYVRRRQSLLSLAASALLIFTAPAFATIAYVAQAENSVLSSTSPVTVTSTLTLSAGDLVEVQVAMTVGATVTVADGLGNTYTAAGSTNAGGSFTLKTYVAQNCAAGTATVVATASVGAIYGVYAKQINGAAISGAVIGYSGTAYVSPGTGLNILASGNIAIGATATNILLSGFGFNEQAGGIPTAGTSPLAFTGRTGVWSVFQGGTANTLPEDLRIAGATGNVQATFGANNGSVQFNNLIVVAVAYAELGGAAPRKSNMSMMGVSKLIQHKPAANDSEYARKNAG